MQTVIKIAFVLLPFLASTQISFYRHYASDGFDFGQGIVQLEDSSYVVTGSSGSFLGHSQAFLMKTDSIGNLQWSNHYGGAETDWGRRVLYKQGVGFYICGYSNSFGNGDYDYYMVKTDVNGNEEWSKTYGGNQWDRVLDARMTRDTGIVMVGETNNGVYGLDMYIVRTDINGDTLWTRTFENYGDDVANAIDIYNDSLLIVAGNHFFQDSLQTKAIMYMIHEDGTMIDTLVYSNRPGNFEFNDVNVVGNLMLGVGSHHAGTGAEWEVTYQRSELSPSGFLTDWMFMENLNNGDWHADVLTSYGGDTTRYLGLSFENNPNVYPGGRDVMVQLGNTHMFWLASVAFLAMEEPDVNGEIIRTSDDGAILVGYHQNLNVGSGGGTIFLYKIGPNETYPVVDNTMIHTNLVGVKKLNASIDTKVYPNPTKEKLHLELPSFIEVSYTLTDSFGRIVSFGSITENTTLDVSTFKPGMYLLNVHNDQGNSMHQIIIH